MEIPRFVFLTPTVIKGDASMSFCKEFPHPNDKQRNDLSAQLGMESKQIKFWFQNRRTQIKTQLKRHENVLLKQEQNGIRAENKMLKEAMRNPLCTTCGCLEAMTSGGGGGGGGGINFEIEWLRLENAQLKD
ncbi:hypothetical protein Q3G72_024767 [Acer saccharum]|nr:hypothetical protein Q3G72_024767 [Acer saccharum]